MNFCWTGMDMFTEEMLEMAVKCIGVAVAKIKMPVQPELLQMTIMYYFGQGFIPIHLIFNQVIEFCND